MSTTISQRIRSLRADAAEMRPDHKPVRWLMDFDTYRQLCKEYESWSMVTVQADEKGVRNAILDIPFKALSTDIDKPVFDELDTVISDKPAFVRMPLLLAIELVDRYGLTSYLFDLETDKRFTRS